MYQVLTEAITAGAFPGCAFGVMAAGSVVLQDALGRFTYEKDAPEVSPDTVFDVASITKVVSTTAAAMLLHQRGILDLDLPLGELLPGFVVGRLQAALPEQSPSGISWRTTPACPVTLSSIAPSQLQPHFIAPVSNCPLRRNRVPAPSIPIRDSYCLARRSKS